ncbi:cysteine synthase A [Elioraea sp.]|jgi:cysteine synthase A|uniref:cysteine synthase A n=1 Tax=Elioraea sp. TaxID=2185103 RepID=UPI0021DE2832|nr:cysteine synthase A [Elioraea sp.]GIX11872.1 MAG: cysteine synthase A [Elioraea sp.]
MDRPAPRLHDSILDTIGATPLVRCARLAAEEGLAAELCLKLEFLNPGASVKDRIGLAMVRAAEASGALAPGGTLIEPTSGNTGIALAMVAAARGYRLVVTMPEGASEGRRRLLRLLGAEVVLTPAERGMAGAIAEAERRLAATPGAVMPRQFDNPANPEVHAATTAEEIWADTAGAVDAVVGGIGTGGTLSGIARALKPRRPGLRVVGVEPDESAVLSGDPPGQHGIQGIGAGFRPAVLDLDLIDAVVRVAEAEAIATARRVARTEGIPVGLSSGAAVAAALRLARDPALAGGRVVAIAASAAERYLATALFANLD